MSFIFGSVFERILEKATSELLVEPDWASNLELCDMIRGEDATAKDAIKSVRRRLQHRNPNVVLLTLTALETIVKNCGVEVHREISSKSFMDEWKEFCSPRMRNPEKVVTKMKELIQTWARAFHGHHDFQYITDTYNSMKAEGCSFPEPVSVDHAFFTAQKAPDWLDGFACYSCRTAFGVVNRKHHCRNCGQIFCNGCSSKNAIIPKFGYEKPVRVCDSCFTSLNSANKDASQPKPANPPSSLPAFSTTNASLSAPPSSSLLCKADEDAIRKREEEEFAQAIALSLKEDSASNTFSLNLSSPSPSLASANYSNSHSTLKAAPFEALTGYEELDKYLDRSQWENRPSAPKDASIQQQPQFDEDSLAGASGKMDKNIAASLPAPDEDEPLLSGIKANMELIERKMNQARAAGRSIAGDPSIQSLFTSITVMHPRLLRRMEEVDRTKQYYADLIQLTRKIEAARASLEELRQQRQRKLRAQLEEQEMLMRIQMDQKLKLLQQQEAEKLEYQQQLVRQHQSLHHHSLPTPQYSSYPPPSSQYPPNYEKVAANISSPTHPPFTNPRVNLAPSAVPPSPLYSSLPPSSPHLHQPSSYQQPHLPTHPFHQPQPQNQYFHPHQHVSHSSYPSSSHPNNHLESSPRIADFPPTEGPYQPPSFPNAPTSYPPQNPLQQSPSAGFAPSQTTSSAITAPISSPSHPHPEQAAPSHQPLIAEAELINFD